MNNPLSRFVEWYRRPGTGMNNTTDRTALGVLSDATLPTGAPAGTLTVVPEHTGPNSRIFPTADLRDDAGRPDVLALLVDEGRTPATPREVRRAFQSLEGRAPTQEESTRICAEVDTFGLLA